MPVAHLQDRALIALSGPDAEHFLQNIVTVDLDVLAAGEARPGALLTPQGKILFDFLVSRSGENALMLECRADVADDFIRRLTLYRLRAKVDISKQERAPVAVSWGIDSTASQADSAGLNDKRFTKRVSRFYGEPPAADADAAAWHAFRIANGIAESGADYALGDAFPHDVLLDELGGVGFRKGCYVGQEVVSRMQHRGTARRRVLIADAQSDLPAPGTSVTAGGRPIGALGSVSGPDGLALVRIDKVADAMREGTPILADSVALHLQIPDWAKFTFPQDAAAGEEL